MANLVNLSASSSFSSNKSYSSSSSSSAKENASSFLTHRNNHKRVVVILNNENNKKFKDLQMPKLTNTSYRHSISFPSSTYVSTPTDSFVSAQISIDDHNINTTSSSSATSPGLDEMIEKSNNSFTARPTPFDKITSGVVKNLRKKFLPVDSFGTSPPILNVITRARSKSELSSNFQLKKSQSVILGELDDEIDLPGTHIEERLEEKHDIKKKTKSITFLNNEANKTEEKISLKHEAKDKFDESAVFVNVDIKEKISKFSVINPQPLDSGVQFRSKKAFNLRYPSHNPMKYGGSCNNLASTLVSSPKLNENMRLAIDPEPSPIGHIRGDCVKNSMSDTDASNDESCSEDLTNSMKNEKLGVDQYTTNNGTNKFNLQRYNSELNVQQLPKLKTKPEYLDMLEQSYQNSKKPNSSPANTTEPQSAVTETHFDPRKFEQDYNRIKAAFDDLKRDNQFIEDILTEIRNKVKETSVSFVDNFLAQTNYDQNYQLSDSSLTNYLKDTTNNYLDISDNDINNIENENFNEASLLNCKKNSFVNSKQMKFEKLILNGKFLTDPNKNKFSTQLKPSDPVKMIRHKF